MYQLKAIYLLILIQIINCEVYDGHVKRHSNNTRRWQEVSRDSSRNQRAPHRRLTNNRQSRCNYLTTLISWRKCNCCVLVLSLFTFVQFNNQQCRTASGDNGTCLTAQECNQRGGITNGPCAGGYGACCTCKLLLWNLSSQ